MNEVCAIGCKSLISIMLYVVLLAVLNFAGYMRYFAVWVCGFVNCVKYVDKKKQPSLQNCVLAIGKKTVIVCNCV